MTKANRIVLNTRIVLDEEIYPRAGIDHGRVALFAENMHDDFHFDPIEVEMHPEQDGKYRILDGFHRVQAYKDNGKDRISAKIVTLKGADPLLYAASRAIGPRLLTEDEARDTASIRPILKNNRAITIQRVYPVNFLWLEGRHSPAERDRQGRWEVSEDGYEEQIVIPKEQRELASSDRADHEPMAWNICYYHNNIKFFIIYNYWVSAPFTLRPSRG